MAPVIPVNTCLIGVSFPRTILICISQTAMVIIKMTSIAVSGRGIDPACL